MSILDLSSLELFGRSSARSVLYSSAKCGTNELESDFLWMSNKGKGQNRVVKKAKYIQDAEKLFRHINMSSQQVPKDFVE